MIRLTREPARTCTGCGNRGPVTCLTLGASHVRCCDMCWRKMNHARGDLESLGLDAIEVR